MKKRLALSLSMALFSASIATACPGGDLIQVIDSSYKVSRKGEDIRVVRTIVAEINISTGELTANSKAPYKVTSIRTVESAYGEGNIDLCKTRNCSELISFRNQIITVSYENKKTREEQKAIVLHNVSVGADVPIAKGMPRPGQMNLKDSTGKTIFACSKKM